MIQAQLRQKSYWQGILVLFATTLLLLLTVNRVYAQDEGSLTIVKESTLPASTNFAFTLEGPDEFSTPAFVLEWGSDFLATNFLAAPSGIAIDSNDNVYVIDQDFGSYAIKKFDSMGNLLDSWSFDLGIAVQAIAVDHNDVVYVAIDDFINSEFRIEKFDVDGTLIDSLVIPDKPSGVAVNSQGHIYVTYIFPFNSGEDVQIYDSDDNYLGALIGTPAFNGPAAVTVDADDNIYIADGTTVQKFDAAGNFVLQIGNTGDFLIPNGVEVDAFGNVYIADSFANRIQQFTSDGIFVRMWGADVGGPGVDLCEVAGTCSTGAPDSTPGHFSNPWDVAIDSLGNLYVTDQSNFRVQKFLSPGFVLDDADPDDADEFSNSITYDFIPAGEYNVTELPVDNWELTEISCVGNVAAPVPVIDLANGALTVNVGSGEDVTCTFRNQGQAQVTIVKTVSGGVAVPGDWSFEIDTTPATTTDSGTAVIIPTGFYTVTETGPADYTVTAASGACTLENGRIALSVPTAGEELTCNITNTRNTGDITFIKDADGGAANDQDWKFKLKSGPAGADLGDDIHHQEVVTLDTGIYIVSEHGPDNYHIEAAEGVCQIVDGKIQLTVTEAGGICEVDNNRDTGKITFVKQVQSGPAQASAWTFNLTSGPAGAPLPTGIAHNSSKILDTGSYFFSESGPQGYALVSASGACQVVDGKLKLNVTRHDAVCTVVNEQTVIRVNESFATTAVTEGGAQDCVWLTLNHKPSGPVTVSVTPRSGEITVNKTSVTLDGNNWNLLDPNQQSNAFCVSAVDDSLDDGGDTLCKNGLAALFGGSLVTDQACGDGLTFVDLALSNSGDARYGAFTPFVSNTLEELDANPASVDVLVQDNDTAGVTLTPAYGVAALDEDGTPVGEACYWVTLDSQPTASVTISAVADAQVAISPASVTLDATNWNLLDGTQPVNRICVTPVNDAVKDDTGSYCADQVADLFGGPVTGQTCGDHLGFVSHAATSADPLYNAISTFRSIGPDFDSNPATLDVLIRNEDVAKVKISPTHLSVVEGGGTEYHVVLTSQPTGPVTVSNGETTLVFDPTNWNVPQTVPVSTLDNDLVDGPREQLFSHTVTSADANYNGLVPSVVSLVIADNDQASLQIGLISPVSGQLVVSEDGQTASYTVQLTAQPTADINVSITVDGQITVDSTSLVFTAANWNVAQTVIVSAVDDDIVEAPTVSLIQHTVSSGDPLYNGQVAPVVETLVLDNDGAGVVITAPDPFQLQEGAVTAAAASGSNSATYTIHLASQPLADVTVFVGYGDRLSAQPASLLFTAANWNVPQAVTLTVKDDDIYQGTQVMLVIHTIISNDSVYHGLPVAPLVVTLLDDESNGGNGPIDGDSDGDGIPDSVECPAQPCRDSDGDGIPDYLDPDDDNDGVPTEVECPGGSNCPDSDDDGTPDYLDPNVPGNHGNNNGGNNGNNGGNNGNNGGNNGNNGNNNGGNGLGAGQTLFLPLVGK